jgi:hypothetical protein
MLYGMRTGPRPRIFSHFQLVGASRPLPVLRWLDCAPYPVIELAAVGIAIRLQCSFGLAPLGDLPARLDLLALAAIDLKYLLPDFLTLPLIPAGLLVGWAFDHSPSVNTSWRCFGARIHRWRAPRYRRLRGREEWAR